MEQKWFIFNSTLFTTKTENERESSVSAFPLMFALAKALQVFRLLKVMIEIFWYLMDDLFPGI